MEYKDYYETLGVPRTATQAEIKKAFRKLAREHHPDVRPGDATAEDRFKDVNEAHAVLSDPAKRRQYDTLGANWGAYTRGGGDPFGPGGPFADYAGYGGPGGNVRFEFRTTGDAGGFSDFFRTFFGGGMGEPGPAAGRAGSGRSAQAGARASGGTTFEDILGGLGFDPAGAAESPGRRSVEREAGTVEATAELGLEEAFHGTTRIVEVGGKRLEVTIPRGVDSGSRIRLKGRGGDGRDIHVIVRVRPHPVFTRRGADLERELPLTLREALLGGEVPVATLKSRVLLRIPAGTQNGRTFRLKGQGMPRLNGGEAGDLYAKARVVLPTGLSPEATTAAEQFFDLVDQPDPRADTA